ncbi:RICIN domain-containing protein [Streptomyces sp. KL116D]|uniref:RICIN domain-containing protein n=1 Tax=Streptomyces sp. KL116D TaxID=3045152 RepID=UPI003558C826
MARRRGQHHAPQDDTLDETSWYALKNAGNGTCVDARAAATTNGTAIQRYTCNTTQAQRFRLTATDSGYRRIAVRPNPQQVIDVTDVSTADNAPLSSGPTEAARTSSGSR